MALDLHPRTIVQPISREAILERRQPYLRWSAIFGGAAVALGLWNGALVSVFGVQPIIATLVLMTAGRGIALLITDSLNCTTWV